MLNTNLSIDYNARIAIKSFNNMNTKGFHSCNDTLRQVDLRLQPCPLFKKNECDFHAKNHPTTMKTLVIHVRNII